MTDVYATAHDMLADLKAKKISARELLDLHVARNNALHQKLNAVVETDLDHARAAAKSIDDARTHGAELGVLAGLPMTIKDGFDVLGMPATAGNPMYAKRDKNCVDADVVNAARRASAVIWGKTNVPFMLGDIQSYNDIYGTTNNPYDVTKTPGGSSGGAAAALAAGITPLEIGSDIGGSLRHPANFCGVVSLKPTWDALSDRGHVPPAPGQPYIKGDLNVVGPMARNLSDLRLLWNVLKATHGAKPASAKGKRVAVWDQDSSFPLASDVRDAVKRAADALSRQGVEIVRKTLPFSGEELMTPYMQILAAVLGIGFPDPVFDAFEAMRPQDKKTVARGGPDAASAQFRLASTASFREVAKARLARETQKQKIAAYFNDGVDAILLPVTPIPAFAHNHNGTFSDRTIQVDNKTEPYGALLNWIGLATSLHLPALVVQAGRTPSSLPVGVQIAGSWNSEDQLFDIGAAVEKELGGFEKPAL
jgi:amidase